MANNLMTFENVVENIVPKVTIQRIILETSATDAPSDPKNPHAAPVDVDGSIKLAFTKPAFSIGDNPDLLKVSLTQYRKMWRQANKTKTKKTNKKKIHKLI